MLGANELATLLAPRISETNGSQTYVACLIYSFSVLSLDSLNSFDSLDTIVIAFARLARLTLAINQPGIVISDKICFASFILHEALIRLT